MSGQSSSVEIPWTGYCFNDERRLFLLKERFKAAKQIQSQHHHVCRSNVTVHTCAEALGWSLQAAGWRLVHAHQIIIVASIACFIWKESSEKNFGLMNSADRSYQERHHHFHRYRRRRCRAVRPAWLTSIVVDNDRACLVHRQREISSERQSRLNQWTDPTARDNLHIAVSIV